MDEYSKSRIEKLIYVYDTLKSEFKWSSDIYSRSFTALIYALSDKKFNVEDLKIMRRFIKRNTGVLSHYRYNESFTISSLLITKFEDPKVALQDLLVYEGKLNKVGFTRNPMLGIAAYALLLTYSDELIDIRINRAREIYKRIKKKHFFLTAHDDYIFSMLISASKRSIDSIIDEIEGLYDRLRREGLSKSNGLHQLSYILALSNHKVEDKINRYMDLFKFFRGNKIGIYSRDYGALGLVTLVGESSRMLGEILEVYLFLKDYTSFKSIPKEIKLLIACSLACNKYTINVKEDIGMQEALAGVYIDAVISCIVGASAAIVSAEE